MTTLYHPQASPVERCHRELKTRIAMFVQENHRNWDLLVKQFCLAHNAAPNVSSGYSPSMLFLGKELNLPSDPPFDKNHDQKLPVYAANLVSKLRSAINKAKLNRESFQQNYQDKMNVTRTGKEYHVGDKVWLKSHFKSDKSKFLVAGFNPRYYGPMEIHEKLSSCVYKLKDLRDNTIQKGYHHIDNLRSFVQGEFTDLIEKSS